MAQPIQVLRVSEQTALLLDAAQIQASPLGIARQTEGRFIGAGGPLQVAECLIRDADIVMHLGHLRPQDGHLTEDVDRFDVAIQL